MKKPKYRNLTKGELQSLEKEFIEFLVINGVAADDWEGLKTTDQAQDILTSFSDVIFESILRKALFLECWEQSSVKAFQCLSDKMVMVGADVPPALDLRLREASAEELIAHFSALEFYQTEDLYHGSREHQLFQMIERGCTITDGALFKKILLAMTD